MPERIKLSRKKGWRKPDNTVVVARPSRWGNPFAAQIPHGESMQPGGDARSPGRDVPKVAIERRALRRDRGRYAAGGRAGASLEDALATHDAANTARDPHRARGEEPRLLVPVGSAVPRRRAPGARERLTRNTIDRAALNTRRGPVRSYRMFENSEHDIGVNMTIDHAAEARDYLEGADARPSAEWLEQTGESKSDWLAAAQVHASLALVEQQRIANVLTYVNGFGESDVNLIDREVIDDVKKGLGLS